MTVEELVRLLQSFEDPTLKVYFSPNVRRSDSVDIVRIKPPHDPLWKDSSGYIDHEHITLT